MSENDTVSPVRRITEMNRDAAELVEYARQQAVEQLLINWRAAVRDGAPIETIAHDLDDTIAELLAFREKIASQVPETKLDPDRWVPSIVITVIDGLASVEAASEKVNVHVVDMDREGAVLDEDDIENITSAEETSGSKETVAKKLDDLRNHLRRKFGGDPAP